MLKKVIPKINNQKTPDFKDRSLEERVLALEDELKVYREVNEKLVLKVADLESKLN
ncbi:hypothetical protein GCM10011346_34160 [Oceanobacillus neutriphilus]|uniref:Transposase n=1 Tax=Oceanobacillus neutriphilus TaxID=531815 RepID=A0ABQ2NYD6_9BACI|nr:hypothetical protein GCM10011346_34160 [Oceanobacillus neutriphilus]